MSIEGYIQLENDSITNFIFDYDLPPSTSINYLPNLSCGITSPEDVINLINEIKEDLMRMRFGIATENIEIDGRIPSYHEIVENRTEFAGYITIGENKCRITNSGDDGVIKDFILRTDKINFHTHPPYNGKWPYAPPSEIDITYLIEQQQINEETIYNAIAAREGIYIYWIHPEFQFKDFDLDYFKDQYQYLKNDLGYNPHTRAIKKLNFDMDMDENEGINENANPNVQNKKARISEDSNPKSSIGKSSTTESKFVYSSPVATLTQTNVMERFLIEKPKITIDDFLDKVNSKGLCTILLPYDEQFGGNYKKYKISYSI